MKGIFGLWLLSLSVLWPACSSAQSNEISLSAGATFTSDQKGLIIGVFCSTADPLCNRPVRTTDTALSLTATLAHRVAKFAPVSLYLELPVTGVLPHDIHNEIGLKVGQGGFVSFFATPSLRVRLGTGTRIAPFVTAGGGLAWFSVDDTIRPAFQFGGGSDFSTPVPLIAIRMEARDCFSEPSFQFTKNLTSHQHNVFAGIGLVLRR